jgi:hypothetical protein
MSSPSDGPSERPPSIEDNLTASPRIAALLREQPRVLNIGLPAFAEELAAAKVQVLQLDWAPPVIADPRIRALLAKLT